MEKTIYIDEKQVKLKATAALPKRYKAQFGRDYFADLMKVAKVFGKGAKRNLGIQDISFASLDHMDMEVFYDIIWTMAKKRQTGLSQIRWSGWTDLKCSHSMRLWEK